MIGDCRYRGGFVAVCVPGTDVLTLRGKLIILLQADLFGDPLLHVIHFF